MIQVRERDVATLKVKKIQMHDLMRDLCLSKAKQENFIFIVDRSNASSLSMIRKFFPEEALEKSLPLELLNYVKKHCDDCCNPLFWILLISAGSTRRLKFRGIWRYMFNNFKLLRVLNYDKGRSSYGFWPGWELPSDIGNLIYLRFLSLKDVLFFRSELPSSLGNLRCLQTLDLRVGSVIIHLEIYGPFYIENFNEKELGENPPIIGSKYIHSLSIGRIGGSSSKIDPRHLGHLLSNCTSICNLSIAAEISELPEYHYFSYTSRLHTVEFVRV
ncbi:hypothetical protein Goshw_013335 [Gossypium schwendimanii]|uniref:Uncharacterized protein n=1 Tax=Gossypium schwendimanii TaxID=34291 RepID=A0A7J9N4J9_GOSSC|nr:hypothetical protein [Gossypium schwendimanii]